jgi:membrane protein
MQKWRDFWKGLKNLSHRYNRSDIQTNSAALAFHTLLAIVPILGLVFLYIDKVGISKKWGELTRDFLLSNLNLGSGNIILEYFDRLTTPLSLATLGWIGVIFLIYTAWNLINNFGNSLDRVLDTTPDYPHIEKRVYWKLLIRRFMVIFTLPIALTVSLVVTHWISTDSWLKYLIGIKAVGPFIALPISWGVSMLALSLIYYLVPRTRVPKLQALKISLMTIPIFEIGKFLFVWSSHHSIVMNKLYGILVVIPLFILWVQLAWMIILCGGIFIRFAPKKVKPHG